MSIVSDLRNQITALTQKVDECSKQLTTFDGKVKDIASATDSNSSPDPLLIKRITELELTSSTLQSSFKSVTDELRVLKSSSILDKSVLETSIYSKLEQNLTKMIQDKFTELTTTEATVAVEQPLPSTA
jgi:hypothetical protein